MHAAVRRTGRSYSGHFMSSAESNTAAEAEAKAAEDVAEFFAVGATFTCWTNASNATSAVSSGPDVHSVQQAVAWCVIAWHRRRLPVLASSVSKKRLFARTGRRTSPSSQPRARSVRIRMSSGRTAPPRSPEGKATRRTRRRAELGTRAKGDGGRAAQRVQTRDVL